MSKRYYDIDQIDVIPSIKSALIDFYGGLVYIYKDVAAEIVFECPSICNKVIRITNRIAIYIGDSWNGSSLVNSKNIVVPYQINNSNFTTHLILTEKFLFIFKQIADRYHAAFGVFGKLSNNEFIALGYKTSTGGSANSYNLSNDLEISMVLWADQFNDDGKMCKQNIIFIYKTAGIIKNQDNSFAYLDGLYNVSFYQPFQSVIRDENIFISGADFTTRDVNQMRTCLLVEFT